MSQHTDRSSTPSGPAEPQGSSPWPTSDPWAQWAEAQRGDGRYAGQPSPSGRPGHDPYARPAAPAGQAPYGTPSPSPTGYPGVPQQGQQAPQRAPWETAPAGPPAAPAPHDPWAVGGGSGGHGASGASPTPPARRPSRRPGWAAVVAVGLVAALVGGGGALGVGALTRDAGAAAALAPSSSSSSSSGSAAAPQAVTTDAVDWQAVAGQVAPSVVAIQVVGSSGSGEGSGVVLDDSGHVLTNYHVVNGGGTPQQMRVVLSDGRVYDDISVVGEDAATDLAVLEIADAPSDLQAATFGSSAAVQPGQPVMAVGNPLGLSDTVTTGIVSAVDRPVTTTQESSGGQQQEGLQGLPFGGQQQPQQQAEQVVTNAIQTDAAINPGNSGGALVDASGSVVGINSSIASTSESAGSIGLGFAIPADEATRIADELISNGTASHAWLGVSLSDTTATADGTSRLAAGVQDVTAGTPAADAGLQAGDAVTAVDGTPVDGAESLTAQLRERAPGTPVDLTVVRDGASQTVTATLGTREDG
ncbi:S1C family serine protease [Pseudokineococcus lusitanus]|uniref:Putative serine protease PepD n=1 Tax=Pseudokineococcus lusitanus TaxID=763993 RepID=A0A3N1HK83_9ACTN|nr:trypsin-like peptidase domain-containing protein [Pseudokineococcus lusitanus]ROP42876.1 putative serine protease PepD [Pseudokineococcus lusitanus]